MSVYGSVAECETMKAQLEAFSRRLDDHIRHCQTSIKGDPLRGEHGPDPWARSTEPPARNAGGR